MIIIVRIVFVEYNDINLDFDDCGYQDDQIMVMIMTKLCLGANYLIIANILHLEIFRCRQMISQRRLWKQLWWLLVVAAGRVGGLWTRVVPSCRSPPQSPARRSTKHFRIQRSQSQPSYEWHSKTSSVTQLDDRYHWYLNFCEGHLHFKTLI